MTIFDLTVPTPRKPLVVEVPHAGLSIPEDVRSELAAPADALLRDADIHVDRLYAHAPRYGATLLVANVSRYVVDLNRDKDDVDSLTVRDHPAPMSMQPRGVVWRAATDGRSLLRRRLTYSDLQSRLERYYLPYHRCLREQLEQLRQAHGYAILLAAHSMPSTGRSLHADAGARRADVVPGTRGRSSAAARVIDLVDAHFRDAGLSVRHDDPYKGGWTTGHYGRPHEHWHAIQIELNRALYVDEETGEPLEGPFQSLQATLDQLVEKLATLDPR